MLVTRPTLRLSEIYVCAKLYKETRNRFWQIIRFMPIYFTQLVLESIKILRIERDTCLVSTLMLLC